MSDELRAPLVRAFERLSADLLIGRYGDPHVAFVVLVHPDREPSIVAVTERTVQNVGGLQAGKDHGEGDRKEDGSDAKGRFFSAEDFDDAANAVKDARSAWDALRYRREDKPGEYIVAKVREQWESRRARRMNRELEQASFESSHQAQCPNCERRFTDRGLRSHQAQSPWSGCQAGEKQTVNTVVERPRRPPPPVPIRCVLNCGWSGPADELPHHLEYAHPGKFVVG